MDFDREYNRARQPADLEEFTDGNVQALVEGRRTKALPRPRLDLKSPYADLRLQEIRSFLDRQKEEN